MLLKLMENNVHQFLLELLFRYCARLVDKFFWSFCLDIVHVLLTSTYVTCWAPDGRLSTNYASNSGEPHTLLHYIITSIKSKLGHHTFSLHSIKSDLYHAQKNRCCLSRWEPYMRLVQGCCSRPTRKTKV